MLVTEKAGAQASRLLTVQAGRLRSGLVYYLRLLPGFSIGTFSEHSGQSTAA